jgi:hypothetical protein
VSETKESPSQHREGLDHLYHVLPLVDKGGPGVADLAGAAGVPSDSVQRVLAHLSRVEAVKGHAGHWRRTDDRTRTAFRDAAVLGFVLQKKVVTMGDVVTEFSGLASASQVYNSLARLRGSGAVELRKTATRTPEYAVPA